MVVPVLETLFSGLIAHTFPHSRRISWLVKRVTRQVPNVQQEQLTLPEHTSSPPFLVVRFVCFVHHCLSLCTFCFGHCLVCLSLIYCFWLPLWYLRFTASDYPFDILDYGFWLPLWYLWFTASDYPFGILDLLLLITPLIS